MNVLFVVPYVPSLVRVRPYNFVRHLAARGHRVTVATTWASEQERQESEALRAVCADVLTEPLPAWRSAVNCLGATVTGDPLQARYSWSRALAGLVRSAARRADVVHVEHLRGAHYGLDLRRHRIPAPVVWDSVDCISDLFEQSVQTRTDLAGRVINRFELMRTRRFEGAAVRAFDRVVVTSALDRRSLLRLAREAGATPDAVPDVHVLPNGVDLEYFAPGDRREADTIVFSGKMSYHANEAAVLRLLAGIMPAVWARRPGARLVIVGKDPSREVRRTAAACGGRVQVTGTVPEVRTYLAAAAVAAAPIVYGVGCQNKVLEAMACGTPVVAASRAVAALGAEPGRDVLVADDDAVFADAIVSLLDTPGRRAAIGAAGRAFVERYHDWSRVAADLESVYLDAMAEGADRVARPAAALGQPALAGALAGGPERSQGVAR